VSDLRQHQGEISIATPGRGMHDITARLASFLGESNLRDGLLTVFCRHTSASLLIQENADPDVRADLEAFLGRLAPDGAKHYRHAAEGPDDMPAHLRAALTATQLSIPFAAARLRLGTWQGVYLCEHRTSPHRRLLALHAIGTEG
jgi:secondary thiamine-phosphate synthase enzyme